MGGIVTAVAVGTSDRRRVTRWGTVGVLAAVALLAGCGSSTAASPSGSSAGGRDLQLRPVLAMTLPGSGSCPSADRDAAGSTTPVSACSTDGSTLYSLGPAAVTGSQVSSLSVQDAAAGGTAEIQVALDDAGTAALANVTKELAAKPAPQSQLAIYVHGRVQSAPVVMAPLTSGDLTIAGDFTKAQAQQLVDGLAVG